MKSQPVTLKYSTAANVRMKGRGPTRDLRAMGRVTERITFFRTVTCQAVVQKALYRLVVREYERASDNIRIGVRKNISIFNDANYPNKFIYKYIQTHTSNRHGKWHKAVNHVWAHIYFGIHYLFS